MSIILNTLKKLEEEKSVLDRSVNLKGLVLQTDRTLYSSAGQGRSNHNRILIALIVGGIVVGVSLGVYFNPKASVTAQVQPSPVQAQIPNSQKTTPAPAPVPPAQAVADVVKETPAPVKQDDVKAKDPIAVPPVQDEKAKAPVIVASLPKDEGKVKTPVVASPVQNDGQTKTPATAVAAPAPSNAGGAEPVNINMELLPDFHEINSIIEDAKSKKIAPTQPTETKNFNAISIPGVKMKGIIYFSEKNPSNYVLLSGNQDSQRKLKIGETINDATLKEVQPNVAIFSYRGELTRMGIGD